MYTVRWCDHEGNEQQRPFQTLEDARLEAEGLDEQYDGVQVFDQNGNQLIW